jgi:multidrug efflux pump subunit AcrB
MTNEIIFDVDKDEVSAELLDMAQIAAKLEDLVSQIKATTYSPFQSDAMKIKFIRKEIQDAGF